MKERYEAPKANIVKIDSTNIICTSGCAPESSESDNY